VRNELDIYIHIQIQETRREEDRGEKASNPTAK
jgi:hypothetical protein